MKNKRRDRNFRLNLFYLISLGVITVGIIVFTILMITKPFDYKELSDLKAVDFENYLVQEPKKSDAEYYYVLVYNNNEETPLVEDVVLKYANYARKNKEAAFLYGFECDEATMAKLAQVMSDFEGTANYPALVKVTNGEAKVEAKTVSSINKLLQDLYFEK